MNATWKWRGAGIVMAIAAGLVAHPSDALVRCAKPCQRIPCDYVRQLKMKIFLGNLFRSKKLRADAAAYAEKQLGSGGTDVEKSHLAATWLYNEVKRIAADPNQNKLPACASSTMDDPPGGETLPNCSIRLTDPKDSSKTLTTPLDKLNTCQEFVNASRQHEENHKDACEASKLLVKWPDGRVWDRDDMKTFADEEASSYETEVYELRKARDRSRKQCTRKGADNPAKPRTEAESAKAASASATALTGAK